MSYNVFIDDPRMGHAILSLHTEDAYDASALVNAWLDDECGYSVSSDLWGAYEPTAMLRPGVPYLAFPA